VERGFGEHGTTDRPIGGERDGASIGSPTSGRRITNVPELPWRTTAARPPAKAPLTRDAIVDAALRVLDREGIDGLSMRKVGEELGTGAASLYWHVRNKDELLQLVFERATEEVRFPTPDPEHWQEQVKEFASAMRAVLRRHPAVARLSIGRIPSGRTLAMASEWSFALLRPAGIPDQVIAYAADLLGLYVGAYAFEESLGIASPTGEDLPPEQIVQMLRDFVRSLPPDQFPHTTSAADVLFGGGPEARFEFGIDVIIRGIASYAADPTAPPTDSAEDEERAGPEAYASGPALTGVAVGVRPPA
jgi:AcrR family transcriptional regulator